MSGSSNTRADVISWSVGAGLNDSWLFIFLRVRGPVLTLTFGGVGNFIARLDGLTVPARAGIGDDATMSKSAKKLAESFENNCLLYLRILAGFIAWWFFWKVMVKRVKVTDLYIAPPNPVSQLSATAS
jgi:hypothetical protein